MSERCPVCDRLRRPTLRLTAKAYERRDLLADTVVDDATCPRLDYVRPVAIITGNYTRGSREVGDANPWGVDACARFAVEWRARCLAAEAAQAEAERRLAVVTVELEAQRKRADDAEAMCLRFDWTFDRPLCSVCLRTVGDYTPGCRGCDDDVPRELRTALEPTP